MHGKKWGDCFAQTFFHQRLSGKLASLRDKDRLSAMQYDIKYATVSQLVYGVIFGKDHRSTDARDMERLSFNHVTIALSSRKASSLMAKSYFTFLIIVATCGIHRGLWTRDVAQIFD